MPGSWYTQAMIELAMPAGTIEEALVAFNAGADAVYFGMKEFSARKGAGNFSLEDLSKIRKLSLDRKRKIYVTVNTLIDDASLPAAYRLLSDISGIGADGIITQDLGIARIIGNDFPSLPLHGSTQLAVHTVSGVKEMQDLGFERVVLSRELTLDEIRRIREACPDIELKVFIHGALCYGFSGLCMASHEITGRSANEGSCAQICRTWFVDEESGRKLYPFSLKDLDAGRYVKELEEIGIDSLKVEGRLKGPGYVDAVTRYYRAIIDGSDEGQYRKAVSLSFQRSHSAGYLEGAGPGHRNMLTGSYTGHQGIRIGKVLDQRGRKILVQSDMRIKDRDGLMMLLPSDGLSSPYRFPAKVLDSEGLRYILLLDDSKAIPAGSELFMISDSSMNMRKLSTDIPLAKKAIPAKITVHDGSIEIATERLSQSYEAEILPSEKSAEEPIIRCFSSSDTAYALSPIAVEGADRRYINPKEMKRIRRAFLSRYKELPEIEACYRPSVKDGSSEPLPERKALDDGIFPWNMKGKEIGGRTYLSFPPVKFDEDRIFREMKEKALSVPSPVIGLNNIGDIRFAKENPQFSYFADIYLYLSNREAAELLREEVPSLEGGYLWVERDSYERPWPFTPTAASGYRMPLFISRSCYRHDSLGLSCDECKRHSLHHIRQNERRYEVTVDDCLTLVR